jgi:hypothetical protein
MRSILALRNPLTFGFSLRARGGWNVNPEMPATWSSAPSMYSASTAPAHKHAMRR